MENPTDKTRSAFLVLRAQSGDRKALDQLILMHQPPLFGFLSKVLGRRSDAEDALQATFLQVIRKLKHVRDPKMFRSWLFRTASRIAYRIANKRQQAGKYQLELLDQVPDHRDSKPNSQDESTAKIPEWLNQLSHKGREAVVLHYLEGFTVKQIANILRVPEGTVKSRIGYALKTIRLHIKKAKNNNEDN